MRRRRDLKGGIRVVAMATLVLRYDLTGAGVRAHPRLANPADATPVLRVASAVLGRRARAAMRTTEADEILSGGIVSGVKDRLRATGIAKGAEPVRRRMDSANSQKQHRGKTPLETPVATDKTRPAGARLPTAARVVNVAQTARRTIPAAVVPKTPAMGRRAQSAADRRLHAAASVSHGRQDHRKMECARAVVHHPVAGPTIDLRAESAAPMARRVMHAVARMMASRDRHAESVAARHLRATASVIHGRRALGARGQRTVIKARKVRPPKSEAADLLAGQASAHWARRCWPTPSLGHSE
jgi:hypothetical protein